MWPWQLKNALKLLSHSFTECLISYSHTSSLTYGVEKDRSLQLRAAFGLDDLLDEFKAANFGLSVVDAGLFVIY
jgi:hypothetical protein